VLGQYANTSSVNLSTVAARWAASDASDRPSALPGAELDRSAEKCATGHSGVLCATCASQYFPATDSLCAECGSAEWMYARFTLVALAILFIFTVLLLRAWTSRAQASSKEVQITKIFFSHLQTVAIVGAVQLRWPTIARDFFSIVDAGSSFTTSGLAIECILGSTARSPFARTLAILAMPMALILFAAFMWFAVLLVARLVPGVENVHGDAEDDDGSPDVGDPTPWIAAEKTDPTPRQTARQTVCQAWLHRMLVSLIVIAFLVHTPLTKAAFRLLTCRSVAPVDDPSQSSLRLSMDLSYDCSDPATLSTMLAIAVPTIAVVSFGIPVGAAAMLYAIGPDALAERGWRSVVGFLYTGYRRGAFFWESVVLIRKAIIAFVTTILAPSGPGMQLATAAVVVLVFLIVHTRVRPFTSNVINALESFALVTAGLSLQGGVLVLLDVLGQAGAASGAIALAASLLIVITNAAFCVAVLVLVSKRGRLLVTRWLYQARGLEPPERRSKAKRRGELPTEDFVLDNPLRTRIGAASNHE
jgi:hypothetical protein